jgi:sugar transferase (PEP-CTERM/EpsH1 system associated)
MKFVEKLRDYCLDVQVVELSKIKSLISVGLGWWRAVPLQVLYYRSKKMEQLVSSTLATHKFDVAYIHLFRMAPYLENSKQLYKILDLTDAISREISRSLQYRDLPTRLLYSFEYTRIFRYERSVLDQFEETWFISASDRSAITKDCPDANIQVISNGIDTKLFFPTDIPPQPFTILFSGHLGVAHNIDAATILAKQVLPRVKQTIPEARLFLVGAEPSLEVRRLNSLAGVTVTGFVDDLNSYLNQAAVFVAPLRFSAGIQNKVLEALAAGRPVITTTIVNEGLGAQPGKDILIADEIDEFVRVIIHLFQNPSYAKGIGRSGNEFVTSRYTWSQVLERINMISTILSDD